MRTDVLGMLFDNFTMDEAILHAEELMESDDASYIVTPNPEIVWMHRTDPALKAAVAGAEMVLADGIGVIYGAKILKTPLKGRVPGVDFAAALLGKMAEKGKSVYLLGGKPGIAEKAAENLVLQFDGLKIAGTADGYFNDDDIVIEKINAASPDVLFVCLGAPKQEYWMAGNAGKLHVTLMAGLGGSIDVFAGTVKRAPEGWRKLGLEWLYRLICEPRRIKRMIKLPLFLFVVIGQRIRADNRKNKTEPR